MCNYLMCDGNIIARYEWKYFDSPLLNKLAVIELPKYGLNDKKLFIYVNNNFDADNITHLNLIVDLYDKFDIVCSIEEEIRLSKEISRLRNFNKNNNTIKGYSCLSDVVLMEEGNQM